MTDIAYGYWASVSGWIEAHHDVVTAALAIAVALFALALWRSTSKLWRTVEHRSGILEQSLEAADRPWIGVTGGVRIHLVVGQSPDIAVTFKNFGRTPAMNVRCAVGTFSGDPALPPPQPLESMEQATPPSTRFPNETFFAKPFGSLPTVQANDEAALNGGQRSLWIFGRVEYSGQTGRRYHTAFRFYYKAGQGLIPTDDGNSAD